MRITKECCTRPSVKSPPFCESLNFDVYVRCGVKTPLPISKMSEGSPEELTDSVRATRFRVNPFVKIFHRFSVFIFLEFNVD